MVNTFRIPSTIHYGVGALKELATTALHLNLRHVLLVTDAEMIRLGIAERARQCLTAANVSTTIFDAVQPDPTVRNVDDGLALLRRADCDGLIAAGGGSVIDCAKAIALRQTNPAHLHEYVGLEKVACPGLPVIAVPTTAGTGSEVTRVTVITDTEHDIKMMIASRHAICAAAIVDPELTVTMPPALTATVGIDALTHAIEAYVSRRAQPMTDLLALSAIRCISHHLRTAFSEGSNLSARSAVMLGAMQAGMAFSNASVALIHGMARPLGARFHLSHGHSIAVLLPTVTEFSLVGSPERYRTIAKEMGVDDLVKGLKQLNRDVKIPSLQQLGVSFDKYESLLEQMATDADASGSPAFNPRHADANDMVSLYRKIYVD